MAPWAYAGAMSRRVIPPDVLAMVEAGIRAHEHLHVLAQRAGVAVRTVCNIKKRLGLVGNYQPYDAVEAQEIELMWSEGLTVKQIAHRRGRSVVSVTEFMSRRGLRRRTWTNHKVLAKNLLAEHDVALVGGPEGMVLLTLQCPITDIAQRHGVAVRTVRRAMLEIEGPTEEERCAPRGRLDPGMLSGRASDFFQELRDTYGSGKVSALIDALRRGVAPEHAIDLLGIPVCVATLKRNFRWMEAVGPKDPNE